MVIIQKQYRCYFVFVNFFIVCHILTAYFLNRHMSYSQKFTRMGGGGGGGSGGSLMQSSYPFENLYLQAL